MSSHQNIDACLNQVLPGRTANRREDGKMCWHSRECLQEAGHWSQPESNCVRHFPGSGFQRPSEVAGLLFWTMLQTNGQPSPGKGLRIHSLFQRYTDKSSFIENWGFQGYESVSHRKKGQSCLKKKKWKTLLGPEMPFCLAQGGWKSVGRWFKTQWQCQPVKRQFTSRGKNNIHGYFSVSRVTDQQPWGPYLWTHRLSLSVRYSFKI